MEEDLGCWCGCAAARAGSLGTQVGQQGQAWVAAPGSLGDPGGVLGGAAQARHLTGGWAQQSLLELEGKRVEMLPYTRQEVSSTQQIPSCPGKAFVLNLSFS